MEGHYARLRHGDNDSEDGQLQSPPRRGGVASAHHHHRRSVDRPFKGEPNTGHRSADASNHNRCVLNGHSIGFVISFLVEQSLFI